MKKFRIRKLLCGKYVVEVRAYWFWWLAIDHTNGSLRRPGGFYYKDCTGTLEECIHALSLRGI